MGFSDAPGYFFYLAILFWILTGIGFYHNRVLFLIAGFLALICTGATWSATTDHNNAYGKPKCPSCGAENKVRPWDL
jgi:succinate-acetate transporter protein